VKIIKLLHWIRDNRINVDGRDVEIDITPYMDELELLSEKNAKLVEALEEIMPCNQSEFIERLG